LLLASDATYLNLTGGNYALQLSNNSTAASRSTIRITTNAELAAITNQFTIYTRMRRPTSPLSTGSVGILTNQVPAKAGINLRTLSSGQLELYLNANTANGGYVSGNRGRSNGTTGLIPIDGNWYKVAVTYDGTSIKFYKDGVLDNTVTLSGRVVTTDEDWRMGVPEIGTSPNQRYIEFDEMRVYNRVLDLAEIAAL